MISESRSYWPWEPTGRWCPVIANVLFSQCNLCGGSAMMDGLRQSERSAGAP
jgi:hypothetical protein